MQIIEKQINKSKNIRESVIKNLSKEIALLPQEVLNKMSMQLNVRTIVNHLKRLNKDGLVERTPYLPDTRRGFCYYLVN